MFYKNTPCKLTNQTKVKPAKKNSWTRPAPLSGKRSISNCFEVILRYIQNDLRVLEPSLEKHLSLGACRNPSGKIIILVLVGTLVNLHGIQCLAMSQYILAPLFHILLAISESFATNKPSKRTPPRKKKTDA